jgi:hypothetical protein
LSPAEPDAGCRPLLSQAVAVVPCRATYRRARDYNDIRHIRPFFQYSVLIARPLFEAWNVSTVFMLAKTTRSWCHSRSSTIQTPAWNQMLPLKTNTMSQHYPCLGRTAACTVMVTWSVELPTHPVQTVAYVIQKHLVAECKAIIWSEEHVIVMHILKTILASNRCSV